MATVENPLNRPDSNNIVEILAQVLAGRIKPEDFSDENQAIFGIYLGIMAEDSKFAALVNSRKNQLEKGQKIPLFTPDEIKPAVKHRRRILKRDVPSYQPGLWPESDQVSPAFDSISDPEKDLSNLHKNRNSRFPPQRPDAITQEIKFKKQQLKNLIGLPEARGKDPHVNDSFYKFLVRQVFHTDLFGIVAQYDRVYDEIPPGLDERINQVKKLVDELLNQGLSRQQRFERFHQFVKDYLEK